MHVNVRIEPRWTLHRGAARGAGAVARDRAARAGARDLEVVEGGAPRRLPRLQPERQGPHHLLGLLGAPAARRARLDAARLGRGAGLRAGRLHRADGAGALRRASAIRTRRWTQAPGSLEALLELAARDEAAGLGDAPWPPHFRKMEGEAPRVAPSRAQGRRAKKPPRAKMPLITIANSPSKDAALAGLERWKARHPEAAAQLAVDDVLVDSMRGRSSTWTRIRVNLRHVPEAQRPPQETPDPDDDPTREWRAKWRKRKRRASELSAPLAKIAASSCGAHDLELRVGAVARLLVGAPAPELRGVAEARALHVIVGDLDDELGAQRLPREILALAPAALARRACAAPPPSASPRSGPVLPRVVGERVLAVRARGTRPARGASRR